MSRLSLALLVALLTSSLTVARASASVYSTSANELQAEMAQEAFNLEFELMDESAQGVEVEDVDSLEEPQWKKLLRPSVQVRRRGKPSTSYTPRVSYGVTFTGPSTYSEGATDLIAPASTSKIFTSALILKELGGDFTYSTRFVWRKAAKAGDAGYLRLTGSGDPSLSGNISSLSEEFVQALIRDGVKRVYGDLKIDSTDARWNRRVVPKGWTEGDGTSDIPGAFGVVSDTRIKALLKARLAKHGIQWVSAASVPFAETAGIYAEQIHTSKPLRELIQPFMFNSINFMGESFLRKVGEMKGSKSAPDLLAAGLPLLREYVGANIGKNTVILNDGCGLSRTSRASSAALVAFLTEMKQEPFFADLFASFPTAGQTGTLSHRMNGTAAAGRIHAKTGTLYTPTGNFQLAGYLVEKTKAGGVDYHPFAILTSTGMNNDGYCRSTQDRVLAKLASWMINPTR